MVSAATPRWKERETKLGQEQKKLYFSETLIYIKPGFLTVRGGGMYYSNLGIFYFNQTSYNYTRKGDLLIPRWNAVYLPVEGFSCDWAIIDVIVYMPDLQKQYLFIHLFI